LVGFIITLGVSPFLAVVTVTLGVTVPIGFKIVTLVSPFTTFFFTITSVFLAGTVLTTTGLLTCSACFII